MCVSVCISLCLSLSLCVCVCLCLCVCVRYLDEIERALSAGEVVLIENMEEAVDPVLGPLLGRETIKKGRRVDPDRYTETS